MRRRQKFKNWHRLFVIKNQNSAIFAADDKQNKKNIQIWHKKSIDTRRDMRYDKHKSKRRNTMNDKNIFDTYDLSDIPDEVKSGLRQDEYADQILQLFRIAGVGVELTVDNITVAYYRKYTAGTDNEPKKKNAIMAKLYSMGRDKDCPLDSVPGKKGTYRLRSDAPLAPVVETKTPEETE